MRNNCGKNTQDCFLILRISCSKNDQLQEAVLCSQQISMLYYPLWASCDPQGLKSERKLCWENGILLLYLMGVAGHHFFSLFVIIFKFCLLSLCSLASRYFFTRLEFFYFLLNSEIPEYIPDSMKKMGFTQTQVK